MIPMIRATPQILASPWPPFEMQGALDGDGDIDRDDILRLTRAIAIEIFGEDYYRAPRIYFLPGALQSVVYDMQVNAGAQAIILLQRLLRDMGFDRAINGLNRLPRPLMALSVMAYSPLP